MDYYKRALELNEETVNHRRYLHTNAEVGLDMPKARAYVMENLKNIGLEPQECGFGVTAIMGNGGKVILLRADMDALPMNEESGEPFACPTGTEAHTCGHDMHAAMLLTAAKMLKENEASLQGTVKFMFQPAEETFEGCLNMLENGLMENPAPDAALAFHVTSGRLPIGSFMYNNSGTMMFSVDGFRINILGRGGHGAYPHTAVDPINIGAHILLAQQAIISREADPTKACALTIGKFDGGSAQNVIPDTAVMEGTLRTNDPDTRELMVRRMKEVSSRTAEAFGGSTEIEMTSQVPPLICNKEFTDKIVSYMQESGIPNMTPYPGISASASEDFSCILDKVPGAFIYISAGFPDERGDALAHNPKVRFNEEALPVGAACLAHCASKWLEDNK